MEDRLPRDGKSVAEIGYYNPRVKPTVFDIDKKLAKEWLDKGAQPSNTIAQYFVKLGLIKSLKRGSTKPSTKKKEVKKEE